MSADDIVWFQEDAAYTYRAARKYLEAGDAVNLWIAALVQEAAAHSARVAREGRWPSASKGE